MRDEQRRAMWAKRKASKPLFIKLVLRKFHDEKPFARTDIVRQGQIPIEQAKRIAHIHQSDILSINKIKTPVYIVKHQKKYGF